MEAFYTALPYVLIVAQAFLPALTARHYAKSTRVGPWPVALLAALPIPVLLTTFALFALLDVLLACGPGACASEREAFATLMVSALALYVFGLVNARLGYRAGKAVFEGQHSK